MTVGPTARPRATALRASRPADHDARVGGVGAARDGCDGHRACRQPHLMTVRVHGHGGVAAAVVARGRVESTEAVAQIAQRDAVLWPSGTGERRPYAGKVQLQQLVEAGCGAGHAPRALLPRIGLHESDAGLVTAREAQVGDGLLVDGEQAVVAAVFGRHVGQRGAVGQGERGQPVARELHELAHHAMRSQQLADDEDEVGGGATRGQGTVQAHADHLAAAAGRAAGREGLPPPRCRPRRSPGCPAR